MNCESFDREGLYGDEAAASQTSSRGVDMEICLVIVATNVWVLAQLQMMGGTVSSTRNTWSVRAAAADATSVNLHNAEKAQPRERESSTAPHNTTQRNGAHCG